MVLKRALAVLMKPVAKRLRTISSVPFTLLTTVAGAASRTTISTKHYLLGNSKPQTCSIMSETYIDLTIDETNSDNENITGTGTTNTSSSSNTTTNTLFGTIGSSLSAIGGHRNDQQAAASTTHTSITTQPKSPGMKRQRNTNTSRPTTVARAAHGYTNDDVIELLSSDDEGDHDTSTAAAAVGVEEEGDDIEIVDPPPAPAVSQMSSSAEMKDDEEFAVVGSANEMKLPHHREHCRECPQFTVDLMINGPPSKWSASIKKHGVQILNNAKICDLCYCYVCDVPAKECPRWTFAQLYSSNGRITERLLNIPMMIDWNQLHLKDMPHCLAAPKGKKTGKHWKDTREAMKLVKNNSNGDSSSSPNRLAALFPQSIARTTAGFSALTSPAKKLLAATMAMDPSTYARTQTMPVSRLSAQDAVISMPPPTNAKSKKTTSTSSLEATVRKKNIETWNTISHVFGIEPPLPPPKKGTKAASATTTKTVNGKKPAKSTTTTKNGAAGTVSPSTAKKGKSAKASLTAPVAQNKSFALGRSSTNSNGVGTNTSQRTMTSTSSAASATTATARTQKSKGAGGTKTATPARRRGSGSKSPAASRKRVACPGFATEDLDDLDIDTANTVQSSRRRQSTKKARTSGSSATTTTTTRHSSTSPRAAAAATATSTSTTAGSATTTAGVVSVIVGGARSSFSPRNSSSRTNATTTRTHLDSAPTSVSSTTRTTSSSSLDSSPGFQGTSKTRSTATNQKTVQELEPLPGPVTRGRVRRACVRNKT